MIDKTHSTVRLKSTAKKMLDDYCKKEGNLSKTKAIEKLLKRDQTIKELKIEMKNI